MSALGLSTLNELACAQSQEDLRGKLVRVGQMIDFGLVTATLLTRDTRGQVSIQRFGIVPRGMGERRGGPGSLRARPGAAAEQGLIPACGLRPVPVCRSRRS